MIQILKNLLHKRRIILSLVSFINNLPLTWFIFTSSRYCNMTYHFRTLIKQIFTNKLICSVLFVTGTRNSSVCTLLKILTILPSNLRITFIIFFLSWFWLFFLPYPNDFYTSSCFIYVQEKVIVSIKGIKTDMINL